MELFETQRFFIQCKIDCHNKKPFHFPNIIRNTKRSKLLSILFNLQLEQILLTLICEKTFYFTSEKNSYILIIGINKGLLYWEH